ncbi:MAG: metalloregulator ArsR/SmtB family transcription factor [Anaerolineales bacterium]|jgi:ArsR family transcriptional regulator
MPAPIRDLIISPETIRYRVADQPVHNALHSMMLLLREHELSGLDEFIVRTARAISKEVMEKHAVIMFGVHYAVIPQRDYDDFHAYLQDLESVDPIVLRDRLLETYMDLPCRDDVDESFTQMSKDEILSDFDTFLAYLRSRFGPELIFEDIERKAYELLREPGKMRAEIVDHLSMMWDRFFAEEFERRQPMIDETVDAFSGFDFEGMSDEEAMRAVTGQWNEKLEHFLSEYEHIVFVPSPHIGPYTGPLIAGDTLWMMFSCRLPSGSPLGLSEVSRAELLVWLSALADDTRLHILALLKDRGELCAQDIISLLDTSQSTVSRHLRQLSASGYVREHRTEAGKCYRINAERFEETIKALEGLIP